MKLKKVTVSTKHQKFEVTERKDGTYRVRVTNKDIMNVRDFECADYSETGDVIWNMANNNDVARDVCHKMCAKFHKSYFECEGQYLTYSDVVLAI